MGTVLNNKPIVAIDIGTTKICVIVGRKIGDTIEVIGMGSAPSHGLKKGVVVDIAKAVTSIRAAVKEAELVANCAIEFATVGVSGSHIGAQNSSGAVPIRKGGIVQEIDVANVISVAKAVPIAEGQQILHVLPKYYRVDGQEKIHNPLGMHGIRLEAQVHIITGSVASVQNVVHCCELAGINVVDIVLEQLASAMAVLTVDEKELGVGVLDIGGGTADLAIYQNGTIRHTMVVPIAGNHFTYDVAVGLRTTLDDAEQIKQNYGLASADLLKQDIKIEIKGIQGKKGDVVQQSFLVHVIESRATELLNIVKQEIDHYQLRPFMTTGMVLTGGGSLLGGIEFSASKILKMPSRIGMPHDNGINAKYLNSPIYATGYGLLLYAANKYGKGMQYIEGPVVKKIFYRMKSWVSELF
jgi:cell division protein FtsA